MRLVLSFLLLMCSVTSANTRDGLVDWMSFDNSSLFDSSWLGNTATATGTTIVNGCPRGGCRSFNGTSDFITRNTGVFNGLNTFTLSLWAKSTYSGSEADLVGTYNGFTGGSNALAAIFWFNAGKLEMFLRTDNGSILTVDVITTSTNSSNDGTWHHLVFQCTLSTATALIYVDTVSQSLTYNTQTTNAGWTTFVRPPYIGADNDAGTADGFFPGQIDDIRLYSRILTTQEIKDLYNSGMKINS